MKLKAGDTFMVTKTFVDDGQIIEPGLIGRVLGRNSDTILVSFRDWHDGHSGDGELGIDDDSQWNFWAESLDGRVELVIK